MKQDDEVNAVDKYEYKLKTEEMLELMEKGAYSKAAETADLIDWRKVRNVGMLMNVSDIYEKSGEYDKSYGVLNIAYHRAEGSRKVIYRLCSLALKTGNVDEAIDFYDDFIQVAPKDPNQYILKYQILRAQRAPVEQQIEALEEFKKSEYIEEWAYELAKLYQEAGMTAECLEECDDLILWFSEGQYVYKAMELKMQYKPLTPSQQEKYDHRYEKFTGETEEIPDIAAAFGKEETEEIPDDHEEHGESAEAGAEEEGEAEEVIPEEAAAEENMEQEREPEVPKKRKLGDTMPLGEALRQLLHPEEKEEKEAEGNITESEDALILDEETEEDMTDLEDAIGAIESVADLDMVSRLADGKAGHAAEEAKKVSVSGEMKELIPEPAEEPEESEEPDLPQQVEQEPVLTAEDLPSSDETVDADQIEGQLSLEDILEGWDTPDSTEDEVSEKTDEPEEPKTEPILPPDIQRMIDEIEGVLPPEEPPKPQQPEKKQPEEPRENMGKVAEDLRIDDDEDLDEDIWDEDLISEEEEPFEEEPEELSLEEEEPFEEEAEELSLEEEEPFEEEAEELSLEEEEPFEEETEELSLEEEEPFEEEAEELSLEEEEPFEEETEELSEEEEEEWEPDRFPDFEEEFRVNPEHSAEPDDREIPDEDDGIDIMSATTPLSRKETAKLIATGKTAPLPLNEISDALSMSDTGFIVHARYDLEMQSGIGTRAGLTEEQKKLFSYFVPVRGMSEQLVDVLEQDKNCTNREGTSRTGNLLIIGNKGNGKTVLAVDVVKAIQKQRNIRQGKVAIVTGESLNKKKIGDIFDKLYGGALIIEKAGKMNEKTVARLNKAMERDTGEMLIVLEEQRKPLDRLLSSNREFRRKFTCRLEVPIFINDELVTFGQTYAQENGYRIDEMGILALYSKIDSLQREDHAVTVAEVKEIMDDAIRHSQKVSAKKLVKKVFGKNTDEADRILLSEKDFNL